MNISKLVLNKKKRISKEVKKFPLLYHGVLNLEKKKIYITQ